MHLCIVNDKFSSGGGGGQMRIIGLARGLARHGYKVTLLAPPRAQSIPPPGRAENEVPIALRRYWANTLVLASALRSVDADALILELPSPVVKGVVGLFQRVLEPDVPLFIDIGDYWVSDEDSRTYRATSTALMRQFIKLADGVAVATEGLRSTVQPWTTRKVLLVPCGVDFTLFRAGSTTPAQLPVSPDERDIVVFAGTVSPFTGCDVIPEFARAVVRHNPRAYFLVVGGGPYLERMKADVRQRSIDRAFHFVGPVHHEEVPGFLAAAKAGISFTPLRRDTVLGVFPMKVPEYMAMGCVPIVNDVGENRWIVEDSVTGLRDQIQNLPAKTASVLRNPSMLSEMSQRAVEFARERFDWDRHVKSVEEAWFSMMNRP